MLFVAETETEPAPCPLLVLSERGQFIARINPDATWSVKWDAVIDQACAAPSESNVPLRAICALLLAGRDNFLTSDWDTPGPCWNATPLYLSSIDTPPHTEYPYAKLVVFGIDCVLAYINLDASWSVDWGEVLSDAHDSTGESPALRGVCALLRGAKDNFVTTPMKR